MHASTTLEIVTPDGCMPVRVFEPAAEPRKGGVLFYMDAFGLRPELDGMCRSYADAGFVVFMPDLYYRLGSLRFAVPCTSAQALDPAMMNANLATTVEMTIADTGAILDHIAATPAYAVQRFGAVGYCMGARHALGAGATYWRTIRAIACLHGGRLVWEGANSPHLYIPRVQGTVYFAFAAEDETCPDEHKALIERTIAQSSVAGRVEHYAAAHGWTFPERWCFDAVAAEHAFKAVLALFDEHVRAMTTVAPHRTVRLEPGQSGTRD
jgi:carboxymethylenebutenolidase